MQQYGEYAEINDRAGDAHKGKPDEGLRGAHAYPPGVDDKLNYVPQSEFTFPLLSINEMNRYLCDYGAQSHGLMQKCHLKRITLYSQGREIDPTQDVCANRAKSGGAIPDP